MPNPIASQAIVFAKQRFAELFEQQASVMARIRTLNLARIRLSVAQREKLRAAESLVNQNVELIKDAANSCYDDESTCVGRLRQLQLPAGTQGALTPLGLESFEILPESFAQFCDLLSDPKHSARLGTTVTALLQVAAREVADGSLEGAVDRCGLAESLLAPLTRIDLPFAKVRDLRPLGTLSQVRFLRLNANQIEYLSPLRNLRSLEVLNLNGNPVSDFGVFASLPLLRTVSLRGTRSLGVETYLRRLHPRVNFAFTDDEVCAREREALYEFRVLNRMEFEAYSRENLAPVYADPRDPARGLNNWKPCHEAAYFL